MSDIVRTFKPKNRPDLKWYATLDSKNRVHVTNDWQVDFPIQYDDGRIAYDWPERVPAYAKRLVAQAFQYRKEN